MPPPKLEEPAVCVVTGGAGFLGSHLVDSYLDEGYHVVVIDNLVTGRTRNLSMRRRGIYFEKTGVERLTVRYMQDILKKHDLWPIPLKLVLNFASIASPPLYRKRQIDTLRAGSIGTEHALRVAVANKARFVQASTSEVYGDPLVHPQHEGYHGNVDPLGPRSCYDEAKRYAEALVLAYENEKGVDARIVRIFNTYGPRMRLRDGRLVTAIMKAAIEREPFRVFGDGLQSRSLSYVDDTVSAIRAVARFPGDATTPVNVGSDQELTVLDVVTAFEEATGLVVPIEFQDDPIGADPGRRRPDLTRLRATGWHPHWTLHRGLQETYRALLAERV